MIRARIFAAAVLLLASAAGATPSTWTSYGGAPLGLSLTNNFVDKTYTGAGTYTTPSTTATPSGGSGVYPSIAWTYVSGDTSIAATSSSTATTAFTRTVGSCGEYAAVWQAQVTDSLGATATATVSVRFTSTC